MVELFGQLSPQGYELFATPDMRGAARQAYELRPDAVLLFIDDPQAEDWLSPLQTLRSLSPVPIIALVLLAIALARPFIFGTVVSSLVAMLIAVSWSFSSAQLSTARKLSSSVTARLHHSALPLPSATWSESASYQSRCLTRTEAASPDSSSRSWAFCRIVSGSRYHVPSACSSASTSDLSTSRVNSASISRSAQTASAASNVQPPAKTDS